MKDIRIRIVFMMILVSLGTGFCHRGEKETRGEIRVPVTVEKVHIRNFRGSVRGTGILGRKHRSRLSFKTGGIIDSMKVEEGDSVVRGRLLASLDLSEIRSRLRQAQSAHEKARRDLERIQGLHEDDAATLQQLENARTALELAASDLKIARFNRNHSVIRAPSAGKILRTFAREGEMVAPGRPVLLFGSTEQSFIFSMQVSDRDVIRLAEGDAADLHFDPHPDQTFEAVVTQIAEMADPATGTFRVELKLQGDSRELRSGFIGQGTIHTSTVHHAVVIPVEALIDTGYRQGYVFVIKAGTGVEKRPVRLGRIFDDSVVVQQGLEAGETIVLEGADYITEGTPVRVVKGRGR